MQLEVGKKYKAIDGTITTITRETNESDGYPDVYKFKGDDEAVYTIGGYFWGEHKELSPHDLIEEVKEDNVNTKPEVNMQLEVGKSYKSRSGQPIRIEKMTNSELFPFKGVNGMSYRNTGKFFKNSQSDFDLIEEVKETKTPVSIVKEDNGKGTKLDSGKPRMDLIPMKAMEEVASVLTFGAKKYDAWNWSKGINYSRLNGAALRHLTAFMEGENIDPETGISHIAHAACNMLFLLDMVRNKPDMDDRRFTLQPRPEDIKKVFDELQNKLDELGKPLKDLPTLEVPADSIYGKGTRKS